MPKVVIADDEEFVRRFIRTVLESIGFKVVAEVEKGDELFAVMQKFNPDILILDINMPKLTGIEFLNEYYNKFPKTCIIILTSQTSFKLLEEASEVGTRCFLRKDLPVEKMIEAIQKAWSTFQMEKHNV